MTTARIAAAAKKNRHHIEAEGNRAILEAILDLDWHLRRKTAQFGDDFGGTAVGDGMRGILFQGGHLRISHAQVCKSRHIAGRGVLEGRQHH